MIAAVGIRHVCQWWPHSMLPSLQADEPLARFLDYCTYGHMIDNVVLIVTGTLHERDVHVSALPPSLCHSLQ